MHKNIFIGLLIILGFAIPTYGATILYPGSGGTGTSTPPSYGQLLVGTASGVYQLQATSTLGITASGDGIGNWFTPVSYGNSTSTTLGFLNGFLSTASSTIVGNATTTGRQAGGYFAATDSTATSTFAGGMTWGSLMFYEGATGRLAMGNQEYTQTINGNVIPSLFTTHTEGTSVQGDVAYHRHSDTAIRGATLYGTRSRGTEASESVVADADNLFDVIASGFDGTDYENSSRLDFEVDGTVSANIVPGRIKFLTSNTSGTMTEAMRITNEQKVGIGSTTPGTLLSIGGTGTGINFVDGTTSTSTFSGNVYIKGNLQVDGAFFAPVTLVASGNTTINGNFAVTGSLDFDTFTSALLLTGAGGDVAEYTGTSCTNQAFTALSALVVATCTSINNDWWSGTDLSVANGGTGVSTFTASQLLYGNGTAALSSVATSSLAVGASITSSGTLGAQVGGTASSLSLNMANANTWTALQTFGNASTTQMSISATGQLYIPAGANP